MANSPSHYVLFIYSPIMLLCHIPRFLLHIALLVFSVCDVLRSLHKSASLNTLKVKNIKPNVEEWSFTETISYDRSQ